MMQELIGKEVEVVSSDVIYRGTLIEIGETEVHLQGETGWIVIPADSIVEIRKAE